MLSLIIQVQLALRWITFCSIDFLVTQFWQIDYIYVVQYGFVRRTWNRSVHLEEQAIVSEYCYQFVLLGSFHSHFRLHFLDGLALPMARFIEISCSADLFNDGPFWTASLATLICLSEGRKMDAHSHSVTFAVPFVVFLKAIKGPMANSVEDISRGQDLQKTKKFQGWLLRFVVLCTYSNVFRLHLIKLCRLFFIWYCSSILNNHSDFKYGVQHITIIFNIILFLEVLPHLLRNVSQCSSQDPP